MKLSEIKQILPSLENVVFQLEDGSFVPHHFHITEVGMITKNFIDCGGTVRREEVVNFQLWSNNDTDHRLFPEKLSKIISISEEKIGLKDVEIEVEYQGKDTIGKFGLTHNGKNFILTTKTTACLASDACAIPVLKNNPTFIITESSTSCCTPGGGCC
jgi:hypothetical protein